MMVVLIADSDRLAKTFAVIYDRTFITHHATGFHLINDRGCKALSDGIQRRLRAVGHMQLIENTADIFGYGSFIDNQHSRYLLIAKTTGDQAQCFQFAAGEGFGGIRLIG